VEQKWARVTQDGVRVVKNWVRVAQDWATAVQDWAGLGKSGTRLDKSGAKLGKTGTMHLSAILCKSGARVVLDWARVVALGTIFLCKTSFANVKG
jgi:hypothetical protein